MKQPLKTGTLSLLLAVVVLCVITLSVLSLSTAAAEDRLATLQAQRLQQLYSLEQQAQTWLAQFDAQLTAGSVTETEIVHTVGNLQERHILIRLQTNLATRTYTIKSWRVVAPLQPQQGMDNLLKGDHSA